MDGANDRGVANDAERLMVGVCKRNADAFEALYDGYHRLVYGIAMRMVGDVPTAQDVTQAVFMKIWSSPELFRGGNFAGWIVRMARNRSLDVLRSRALHPEAELSDAIPEDTGLEEIAFAHLDSDRVKDALSTLPSEQREAIELGFFAGVTHEEIAKRTGIPLGTIKTRIRMGLKKLRAALSETVMA